MLWIVTREKPKHISSDIYVKIMGVSVVTLGLIIFLNKSYSQNALGIKLALKSGRPVK